MKDLSDLLQSAVDQSALVIPNPVLINLVREIQAPVRENADGADSPYIAIFELAIPTEALRDWTRSKPSEGNNLAPLVADALLECVVDSFDFGDDAGPGDLIWVDVYSTEQSFGPLRVIASDDFSISGVLVDDSGDQVFVFNRDEVAITYAGGLDNDDDTD